MRSDSLISGIFVEKLEPNFVSELWTRRNVIATVIMGVLAIVVTLGIYFYDRNDAGIGSEVDTSEPPSDQSPGINISSVYLSEVAMSVPAFFELSIQPTFAAVIGAEVIIDFGRAEVDQCGYTPMRYVENVEASDKSYRRFELVQLGKDETFYVRCIIDSPFFSQVIIQGGNINIAKSLTFEQYQDSVSKPPMGFWPAIGYSFVVFFSLMFCFKVVGFLFDG